MEGENVLYVSVILPVKFNEEIFYVLPLKLLNEALGSAGIAALQGTRNQPPELHNRYIEAAKSLVGRRVAVTFGKKEHIGVIRRVAEWYELPPNLPRKGSAPIEYKAIDAITSLTPVTSYELQFWEEMAHYYLCSIGEVYKAAYPSQTTRQETVKSKVTAEDVINALRQEQQPMENKLELLQTEDREQYTQEHKTPQRLHLLQSKNNNIVLSEAQQVALQEIESQLDAKPVLLEGITGSGKTEIYITLAGKALQQGKNVLYLVPEIAMSKQLESRLKEQFGARLLTFHHKQTQAAKKLVRDLLNYSQHSAGNNATPCQFPDNEPFIVLGTRSSLFLPFRNLGLIIVDEEHDASYKQEDPAPRYNARDAAFFLRKIHSSKLLLGSATPSLETLYNCKTRRFAHVLLKERYYKGEETEVTVIDTLWTRKSHQMKGSFSQQLINMIEKTISNGEQVMIFRNIRSYAPVVQCSECGEIVKCPHCNVVMSYHKSQNELRCHYCGKKLAFTAECPSCHKNALEPKGAGTEKIEEEAAALFPNARIARYDADIPPKEGDSILREFAQGKIDIIVGTQMLSKGFDFSKLGLVAVISADSVLAQQDFRADERALQLFEQLMGRCGRREKAGEFVLQTNQKKHPVIEEIADKSPSARLHAADATRQSLLAERNMFCFPPFTRMVNILVKHRNYSKVKEIANEIFKILSRSKFIDAVEISEPFAPALEKIKDEYQLCISVKFARNNKTVANKDALKRIVDSLKNSQMTTIDVDPY